ncbi:MAG: marine proteobacterial sortase target protein [Thermodesulfobacteriota bacterium]
MEKKGDKRVTPAVAGVMDPGNLLLIAYVVVVAIMALLGSFQAVEAGQENDLVEMSEVRGGELLFRSDEEDRFKPALQLATKVDISISGMIGRIRVQQRFTNSTDQWQEGLYVFPLPDESAVDSLQMKIGERLIEGMVREREEAKKTYEAARERGQKASLLVQERANIFTSRVANIGPKETVEVIIEYQEDIRYIDNTFSLRFPMVVGPRYIPGQPLAGEDELFSVNGTGWAVDTDRVADASRITPHVTGPESDPVNPVELRIDLMAGFPLLEVKSLYHGIKIIEKAEDHREIVFDGTVHAERDFVLQWRAAPGRSPRAAFFSESVGGDRYLLVMLLPQAQGDESEKLPREVVFILDVSGSMAGDSISQAKEALLLAVSRLGASDRFNVIAFNNSPIPLFDRARPVNPDTTDQARRFITRLTAQGGTEIRSALELALDGQEGGDRIRQLLFLTDGCVGNEEELLGLISKKLGDSRLFTIGIGSAPNSYFMSRAATMGRGSFTYIGKPGEFHHKMMKLVHKLEHPALTDISLSFGENSGEVEIYPAPLPDLYHGEPLVAAVRVSGGAADRVSLGGSLAATHYQKEISFSSSGVRQGVAKLWARKKIRSLMDSRSRGADREEVRKQVIDVALTHHLVSKYTSLVAVEKEVSRPSGEKSALQNIKTNLPEGWRHDAVFGGSSRTATGADLSIICGLLLLFSCLLLAVGVRRRVAV